MLQPRLAILAALPDKRANTSRRSFPVIQEYLYTSPTTPSLFYHARPQVFYWDRSGVHWVCVSNQEKSRTTPSSCSSCAAVTYSLIPLSNNMRATRPMTGYGLFLATGLNRLRSTPAPRINTPSEADSPQFMKIFKSSLFSKTTRLRRGFARNDRLFGRKAVKVAHASLLRKTHSPFPPEHSQFQALQQEVQQ